MPPAVRLSRVEDAYDQLRSDIRSNRLPPGFQATEPELARLLGMSRTPVREALIRLEAEGLVQVIPRRGIRVTPIRPDDMREIYDILTALEPDAAARLAASRPDAETLRPLGDAMEAMERALARQDLTAWAEADDRFHLALLELQDNRRLKQFACTLYDQAHRARMVTLRLRGLPDQSTAEHRDILDHLSRGDAEAARLAFRRHRQRAAKELLAILETYRLTQL